MLTHALVRPPSANFADGLTSVALGKPDVARALEQHACYCAALEQCGLVLTRLAADADFPDSAFVEDTAIVTGDVAILTRPGAAARAGEVARIEPTLRAIFLRIHAIATPGTLDGGDVCRIENHCFIGLSERTNEDGARQLAGFLAQEGCTSTAIDIRGIRGILHLKSGISYLGNGRIALIDAFAQHTAFRNYEIVQVARGEGYAANLLRLNDHVVIAAGFPKFEAAVRALGYDVIALDMSEFRKMDGALTCLSLRF
ncbi:MAG TPA: arginine deiminase family protein [Rudaea sp.]|jgi:dimethylargininase|uniref:dimethylarginine dimethylaminohydrolase family protein n=1 Tax=Rudaea sp. TaxID=2136325 RepID=UPI002F934E82